MVDIMKSSVTAIEDAESGMKDIMKKLNGIGRIGVRYNPCSRVGNFL